MIGRAALLFAPLVACSHAAPRDLPQYVAPELSAPEVAEHLLSRVTFGARPEDRRRIAREGVAAFLDEQFDPGRLDDGALDQQLGRFDILQKAPGALAERMTEQRQARKRNAALEQAPPPPGGAGAGPKMREPGVKREVIVALAQAKVLRAAYSRRQLLEVMTDFWFNHFNVFAGKAEEAALLPAYEQEAIRAHALGTFPELLEATARSPAMLLYLDNWRSAAPRPFARKRRGLNENYARELLELHTLGVDGGYTEKDIVEVARCFTGWTIAEPRTNPHFVFRPAMHDFGPKLVLGHALPAGRGEEDGEEVLRILARHPATARFIALELARRFVSDQPPPELVDRVAETYRRTGGDIRPMLRTIFESPEFWSRDALRAKVRSPLEMVAGSVRALEAKVDDPLPLARAVARMGEPLYLAQAPTGYPDGAQTWLSSGALLSRIDFGLRLANGQLPGTEVDLSPLADASPEGALQKAAARLGAVELSEKTRGYVLDELKRSPQRPELLAARAVGLLLGAPELQRR